MHEATHQPREASGSIRGGLISLPGERRDARQPNNLPLELSSFVGRRRSWLRSRVAPSREYWLLALVYGAAALAVALLFGPNLTRKASMRANNAAVAGPEAQSGS